MHAPGGTEMLIIALLIMVVFGAKRLPDSARALGRSMRILKAETRGLHEDGELAALPVAAIEGARFDAITGAPLAPAATAARFDVLTGAPLARFDAVTGAPLTASTASAPALVNPYPAEVLPAVSSIRPGA